MSREHVIDPTLIHHFWDDSLAPILEVEPGDVVHYDLLVAGDGQVKPGNTFSEVTFDFDTIYNLSGPVAIAGAEVGQTLCVEVLALEHKDWGWTAILPGLGLLPDDFPAGYLRTFDLRERDTAQLGSGVEIPLRPFIGTMGVPPQAGVRLSPFPPHLGGGNIDNRYLTVGARLYLPILLPGGLFSCGDPHAVQGDGEVCVTALEAPLRASLRFTLQPRPITAPAFVSGRDDEPPGRDYCTMGIAPDLMEGCRLATRHMVEWLVDRCHLSAEDAYILCSLAGRLRILEVVDAGMWNVAMCMPLAILPQGLLGTAEVG